MRIPRRTGAVHRPRRPIIGSPDAQPAATPDPAVGDRTPFLRLPRHPRSLPVSGGRPPAAWTSASAGTTLSIGPADLGAARHRRARGPGALAPPEGSVAVAAGRDRRLRAADRRQRDPELGRCGHRGREAVRLRRPRARRRRVRRHAPAVRRTSPASSSPSAPLRSPGARSSSSSTAASGRGRSWASTIWPRSRRWRSCSGSRTSSTATGRPPAVGLVGIGVGTVGIVLGASLASVLGLYLAAVAMVALALARHDLRRRAVVVTVADLRRRDSRDLRRARRRSRLSPVLVRAAAGDAGAVRRELEPPADLRLHRRPRLPRQPVLRHRLGGRAAASRLRPVPPRRARALPRPAAALLPAGDRHADPAADVRSGALRARPRRSGVLPRARRPRDRPRGGRGPEAAAGRAVGRAGVRPARLARRRSAARSPARRSSAARRWRPSSG